MAPGYVIAVCLEGAGAIGILVALRLLHTEQRARAAELARFLRSGQIPDAQPLKIRAITGARAAPSIPFDLAATASRFDPSVALAALRSACGAPSR